MIANNVLRVSFGATRAKQTAPLYQYDYGQRIVYADLDLPTAYTVHFASAGAATSYSMVGDETGVLIPDALLQTARQIDAYLYLHAGEDDGETEYVLHIPVIARPAPSDEEPTPVQRSYIEQAIVALDSAVEQTAADVEAADLSAQEAAAQADRAETAADLAEGSATAAEAAERNAALSATAAENAADDAENAAHTASTDAANASHFAESASGSAITAALAASDAETAKEEAEAAASAAAGSAASATASATTAGGAASNAATAAEGAASSAASASGAASRAAASETAAAGSKADAETAAEGAASSASTASTKAGEAAQSATDAQGSATAAASSAQEAAESADAAQEIVDEALADKAPAIMETTPSAPVAVISDAADDMPMGVTVAMEPIQDLHGYDAPWGPGMGKNLLELTIELPATWQELNLSAIDDGIIKINGTYSSTIARVAILADDVTLQSGEYILNGISTDLYQQAGMRLQLLRKSDTYVLGYDNGNGLRFTLEEETSLRVRLYARAATTPIDIDGAVIKPMIRLASETDNTFAPYSNVCPISGRTGISISQSGADTSTPTVHSVDWETEAGTVYGGKLTVQRDGTVKLIVDTNKINWATRTPTYESNLGAHPLFRTGMGGRRIGANTIGYSSEYAFFGNMSSNDAANNMPNGGFAFQTQNTDIVFRDDRYIDDTLYPTNEDKINAWLAGMQDDTLVYPLATPKEIALDPLTLKTLFGDNRVWSDGGDVSVVYAADTKTYVDALGIPTPPSADGTYTLRATISGGVVTFAWVLTEEVSADGE